MPLSPNHQSQKANHHFKSATKHNPCSHHHHLKSCTGKTKKQNSSPATTALPVPSSIPPSTIPFPCSTPLPSASSSLIYPCTSPMPHPHHPLKLLKRTEKLRRKGNEATKMRDEKRRRKIENCYGKRKTGENKAKRKPRRHQSSRRRTKLPVLLCHAVSTTTPSPPSFAPSYSNRVSLMAVSMKRNQKKTAEMKKRRKIEKTEKKSC